MKTIRIRKTFSPFISNNTKETILNIKALLEEAAKTNCKILKREANRLGKVIKKKLLRIGPSTLKINSMTRKTPLTLGEQQMNY